jgi:hypothetical protein
VEGRRGGPGVGERGGVWRSGLELLPDLPRRDSVLGGLTIAPQLAVEEGALGFWPALREVFPATRQARARVHQPADVFSKLPLLRVPTRWALLVLFQRPMTTVFRKPWGDEEELLARWADERRVWDLSRPAGPGWAHGWTFGPKNRPVPKLASSPGPGGG